MMKYLSRLGGCRCRPRRLATSAGAFRCGLRFSGRSCRSVSGTTLRTRGAEMGKSLEVSKAGRLCARGVPTVWRDPKDGYDVGGVRRMCGVTAWRVLRSRGPGHWLCNRRAARRCVPAYRLPSGAARGYAATIVGGSVSERPKVQHSKCCVVNSHRGFKSRRYRHNRFIRTLVME